jgi:hypothetical protein
VPSRCSTWPIGWLSETGFSTSPEDFSGLVAPLNDFSFVQPLDAIKASVDEAIPGLLADFADWSTVVKRVRNHLAHWLVDGDDPPPTTDEKVLVFESLPWVLRTLLLYRAAGLDVELMRAGYDQKPEYPMFRANVRELRGLLP